MNYRIIYELRFHTNMLNQATTEYTSHLQLFSESIKKYFIENWFDQTLHSARQILESVICNTCIRGISDA